jgi:hypothetical protein
MIRSIVIYILAVIFLLTGCSMFFSGETTPPELQDASELKRNEFVADAAYELKGLEIWEKYGSISGSSNESGMYCIALYPDAKGQFVFFSVYLDNSEERKEKLRENDFLTSSLSVDACFQSQSIERLGDDMEGYYTEAVDYAVDYLREYGQNPIDSGLHLRYVCDESADYDEAAPVKSYRDGGIFMLVIGAGFLLLGFFLQKKARKAERKAQLQFEALHGVPSTTRDVDYRGPEF